MKRFFCTSNKPQPQTLEELLKAHNKNLTEDSLKTIQQFVQKEKVNKMPLWRMSNLMRIITNIARAQVYLYGVVSVGYLLYAVQTKWHKSQQVRHAIKVVSPIIIVSALGALRISTHMSKILAKQVVYYPQTKQVGVKFYTNLFTTTEIKVPPTQVKPIATKKPFQAVNFQIELPNGKTRKFTTQVFGAWTNRRLLYHLINGRGLDEQPDPAVQDKLTKKKRIDDDDFL